MAYGGAGAGGIMKRFGHTHVDVVRMDTEGARRCHRALPCLNLDFVLPVTPHDGIAPPSAPHNYQARSGKCLHSGNAMVALDG